MLRIFRRRRIAEMTAAARAYLSENWKPPAPEPPAAAGADSGIRYSLPAHAAWSMGEDAFDARQADLLLADTLHTGAYDRLRPLLAMARNRTFVDKVNWYIQQRGLRVTAVYRAAQMDRRLFSKVMSDREYSPSKDTVLAIAFALRLSEEETVDLLNRAGYSLSRSSQRDIVIGYFFRAGIHDLDDINDVLAELGLKTIGR